MSCSDVQTIKAGDGSKKQFSFDFPYIFKSEIHVYFWNATTKEYDEKLTTDSTYPWRITDANPTIVEFTGDAPPAPATPVDPGESAVDNVKIRRVTKVDDIRALFNPGSAIRSDDLNKNFEQLRYAIQEANCQGIPDDVDQYLKDYYWDRYDNTLYEDDTWVSNDTKIATTAAMDARFLDETNETYTKAELAADSNVLPDDDVALPTTGALKDYVDHAVETDILVNDTGLSKSATGGKVTLGIAEGSVDLDRIKPADIITSSESNPNNDTTIATTAAIDNMIDAAITGDIAVDSTGLTVTNDGDGTITLGIGSNSVDFDRIKNDDIITKTEQDSGSPAAADSNIFTASAAAKRFDTLVQTGTPSESSYEVGKTWLQNDDDQTLKIWNGSTWLDVASGGSFRTQDKVIYVDNTGGDDSKTGHRISGPKLTIKAAINDINADISTSIKTAGSGYEDGTYQDVPLTGGTTGSGLTADITVSGGAVTEVTDINASTLEEYQIGDILSAADSNLGSGGGSGFELEVTGGGDGMTVIVAAGVYQEAAPIQIKRRNVSIIGMSLRSTIVHPTVATEKPSSNGNSALFELNSGSFIQNLTLTGMQASSSGTNTVDSVLPDKQGWNFAFYDDAFITKSPYIQNCTNFSDSQIDNSDLRAHRPRGGDAGDLTNAPTGGGMLVDGSVPKSTSPLRSMVADSYTHVGLNGPGILVTNNGYTQCTSSYAFFNKYHIKALNGGQANLAASTTDFGEKALVADGKSTSAIFTATVNGAAADGDLTFDIDGVTAGTGWFGDDTKPASNMLVTVNSVTYPILSSTVITGGHRVTVSRPDPDNRSTNLGLNGAVDDNAAVSFFLRSQIASSGHTMEYVGSGMDYDALPENGGVPDESDQITELNNGKIWTAITDHNGKFKIGGNQTDDPIFEVDQQRGFVTIPEGSIAFNLLSDLTPQLGGNLDVNGQEIVTDSGNENIVLNPHGTGAVNVSSSKIINVTDPTADQDAATKKYVDDTVAGIDDLVEDTTPQLGGDLDVNGKKIVSTSDGDIEIEPNGTGNIVLDGAVGIGTTSPNQLLTLGSDTGNATIGLDFETSTTSRGSILYNAAVGEMALTSGYSGYGGRIVFDCNGSERLRIDSSGRLLVATTSSTANSNADDLQIGAPTDSGERGITVASSAAGSIRFADDGNDTAGYIFYSHSDNSLRFGSNGSESVRLDSSGQVILNNSAASGDATVLRITGGTSGSSVIEMGDTADTDIGQIAYYQSSNAMAFRVNASEAMRIDSSGRLLLGTTTARANLTVALGNGSIPAAGASTGAAVFSNGTDDAVYGVVVGANTSGTGYIQSQRTDGTATTYNLAIQPNGGNAGIGTADANAPLEVRSSSALQIRTSTGAGNYWEFGRDDSTGDFFLADDGLGTVVAVDQLTGNVGIKTAVPDGTLHVYSGSAGTVTATTGADDIVVENNGDTGISILAADGNNTSAVIFGNATDNVGAAIRWTHDSNEMAIGPDKSGAHLRLNSGDGAEAMRIESSGVIKHTGSTGADETNKLARYVVPSHDTNEEDVVVFQVENESSSNQITFGGGTSSYNAATQIVFRTASAVDTTVGSERMRLDSSGNVFIGNSDYKRGKLNVFNGDDFDTATLNNGDNIFLMSDATSGNNVYGASIAFSRTQYPDRKAAAITAVQTSSDAFNVGLAFFTHSSTNASDPIEESARIDGSGRLLVGTSADRPIEMPFGNTLNSAQPGKLVIEDSGAGHLNMIIARENQSNAYGPAISLVKSRGTSDGSYTAVQSGDNLGTIQFGGADGSADRVGAAIVSQVDTTPGSDDMPGRLMFATTPDGSGDPTERMRIDSSGNVGIGLTSPSSKVHVKGGSLTVEHSSPNTGTGRVNINVENSSQATFSYDDEGSVVFGTSTDPSQQSGFIERMRIGPAGHLYSTCSDSSNAGLTLRKGSSGDSIDYLQCRNSANTLKLVIESTGDVSNTNNSYGQISDAKLKENIVSANSQWDDIKAVQVRNFNFKEETGNPTHTQIGVVAQEVETVSPGLVSGSPDRDDDGNDLGTVTKSVKYSVLYMKAVKALQEAMDRIETLETKVAALEAAE